VRIGEIDTQQAHLNDFVQKVGLVFQNPFNQISGSKFTVYEEIAFGLENRGVPREEMKQRIDRIMEMTGIQIWVTVPLTPSLAASSSALLWLRSWSCSPPFWCSTSRPHNSTR